MRSIRTSGLAWTATIAGALLLTSPLVAVADDVYGGLSHTGFPIVLQVNKSHRQVVRATLAVETRCTSGSYQDFPDNYYRLRIARNGTFGTHYGPETFRNTDGSTYDIEGSIHGKFNKARTKVSGTWRYHETDYDGTATKTDTCDSGTIKWSAKA